MQRYGRVWLLTVAVVLLSLLMAGCSGGVPQEQYDAIAAQVADIQTQLASLQADKTAADAALRASEAEVADLQGQVSALKGQYELTGATKAETAEKIVRNYHETHVYSAYDMFVCSDMASEVWNMLKAQDIGAIVVVGNKDTGITDILQSNHAWVLAEVATGDYLALETTGGYSVPRTQNPLYYRGWSFDSPADLKANNDLIKEYNLRVGFRNQLADEVNAAMGLYNNSTNQAEADKYLLLYNKLVELKNAQETTLNQLMERISGLATKLL